MKKIKGIYIVDDDPITVFGIKKMLNPVAICDDIQVFEHGKTALDDLQERIKFGSPLPSVIFLDINMPIMDGWDFLEEIITMELKEKMVINMITSSIDPSDYQKWDKFRLKCIHQLNFKNKPIFKIQESDLEMTDFASKSLNAGELKSSLSVASDR